MGDPLQKWLDSGEYLPEFMRDFHDQKDLFRAIDEIVGKPADYIVQRPNWVEAQCYTVDVFLWFMARRGYTLQRSRAKLPFRDVEADVAAKTEKRHAAEASILQSAFQQKGQP